jgi:SHS2 domain-containing protein
MMGWEHFAHEADIGVRGRGGTCEEAFAQAALAMTAVVVDPARVASRVEVHVTCENPDPELLLADWLNAIVFEMASRNMLFGRYRVEIEGGKLRGTAWGETVDRERHQPVVEVKGATYTDLRVAHDPAGGWVAQCVVDV